MNVRWGKKWGKIKQDQVSFDMKLKLLVKKQHISIINFPPPYCYFFIHSICSAQLIGYVAYCFSGIHRRLHAELQQHTALCQKHVETFQGCSALTSQISSYLSSDDNVPLVLHGCTGCGKSALAAMTAKMAEQVLPNSACVLRFVGSSPESSTPNQVFRSVCEQIAYLYGEHISIGARVSNRTFK